MTPDQLSDQRNWITVKYRRDPEWGCVHAVSHDEPGLQTSAESLEEARGLVRDALGVAPAIVWIGNTFRVRKGWWILQRIIELGTTDFEMYSVASDEIGHGDA